MDIVYNNFLEYFSQQSKAEKTNSLFFSDFFDCSLSCFKNYKKDKINITKLNNGKYFISNQENKGFSLEQNSNINKLENINSTYKSYQQKIGKITEIFGFENDYFKNLIEVLSNDELSKGLGDYTNKFLRKSKNIRKFENIDIDKIFTIAYEANGNRIVINNENEIYIYAHDLIESRYEIINDIPKNTFYKIPKISTLEEFIKAFFEDFLNK